MQILAVSNVVKAYSRRRVVDRVSLDVRKGEIVGLLGPNGAGKTTTFYMVVGLIRPDEGRILLSGKDITHYPMYRRAREAIGYLSQEPSIFRKLTVADNIRAILEFTNFTRAEQSHRLETLLDELNVKHLRDNYGYSLSGGERRRVEIARSLATDPHFILLDEPFAGVDPIAVSEIQSIIRQLKRKGLGLLITDHSVRETLEITDRAYVMNQGRVLVSGTSREVIGSELARRIYLGNKINLAGGEGDEAAADFAEIEALAGELAAAEERRTHAAEAPGLPADAAEAAPRPPEADSADPAGDRLDPAAADPDVDADPPPAPFPGEETEHEPEHEPERG